jgi:hypothetical protein
MSDKFCVDCRHKQGDMCARSVRNSDDELGKWLATGEGPRPANLHFHCWVERASRCFESCGPLGKFFEPKASDPDPVPFASRPGEEKA